jgi:hypothetical protein
MKSLSIEVKGAGEAGATQADAPATGARRGRRRGTQAAGSQGTGAPGTGLIGFEKLMSEATARAGELVARAVRVAAGAAQGCGATGDVSGQTAGLADGLAAGQAGQVGRTGRGAGQAAVILDEAGATVPDPMGDLARQALGRAAAPPPQGETAGGGVPPQAAGGERPARTRTLAVARPAPEVDAGALLSAAAAAAGLGARPPAPRGNASPATDPAGGAPPSATAAQAQAAGRRARPAPTEGEGQAAEEPRRPAHEVVALVPGRKEPVFPSPAGPDAASPGAASPHGKGATSAASLVAGPGEAGRPTELRASETPGLDGAILRSAAHFRIEGTPGGPGDIELHLRLRGDVAHVRIDGSIGRAAAANAPELASALATAGLTLGKLDTPQVAASSGSSFNASGDRPFTGQGSGHFNPQSQGQPEPHDRGAAAQAPPPAPRASGGQPGRQPPRGSNIHVEA